MKKILFDGTATQGTSKVPFHGGADYAIYILKEAISAGYRNFDIVFYRNYVTNPSVLKIVQEFDIHTYLVDSRKDIYLLIDNGQYSHFFSALPVFFDYHANAHYIKIIHGLRSIELPWDYFRYKYTVTLPKKILYYFISKMPCIIKRLKNKHIRQFEDILKIDNSSTIVVSAHTKYSIAYFFPFVALDSIEVFASPMNFQPKEKVGKPIADRYFLLVNGNRYEKNIYRAIKTFDVLFTNNMLCDKKVVVTGAQDLPFLKEIKNRDNFIFLDYVDEDELEMLYANAWAFIYPSLNEGYGYPPLKAMIYGVPVVASSSSSIPEICGNAAIYFIPTDMNELANRILQIDNNFLLREKLVCNGKKRIFFLQNRQLDQLPILLKRIFE